MSRNHQRSFIGLCLIAAFLVTSANAQETSKSGPEKPSAPATRTTVANTAAATAPTVQTKAGIVRGVTEGMFPASRVFPMLRLRSARIAGARRNPCPRGRECATPASSAQIVRMQDGPAVLDQLRRVRRKIACSSMCGDRSELRLGQNCR